MAIQLNAAGHALRLEFPPLIELSPAINPLAEDRVRIFAQVCGDNIKRLPAANLLMEAKAAGRLAGVHTLVEGSSGNMALALGLLGPAFGVPNVLAIVSADIASGKLDPLRLSRVQIEFATESRADQTACQIARAYGQRPGYLNLAQYENEANPRAFEQWLAPRIWEQAPGQISVVAAGLGTTGTAVGLSRFFKRQTPAAKVIGVMVEPGQAVPGVRTERRLAEIGHPWRESLDAIQTAGARDSFKLSRQLWWELNFLVGPSSGFALAGLLSYLGSQKAAGALDSLRNAANEVFAVFICPDYAYPYFDKYSTHLDPPDLS